MKTEATQNAPKILEFVDRDSDDSDDEEEEEPVVKRKQRQRPHKSTKNPSFRLNRIR